MAWLNDLQRRTVLANVLKTVEQKLVSQSQDTPNIGNLRQEHEAAIVGSTDSEQFEQAMNGMLRQLGSSHTGFFHESKPRAAARIAIAATFTRATTPDGPRWVFQDVHPGGVAHRAGIQPGDVLLTVDDKELVPPDATPFLLGHSYALRVRKSDGSTVRAILDVPNSKEQKRPIVIPDQVVTASKLAHDMGLIRISMFPGVLGMDVARDISRAVSDLQCRRLIFDLRGNTGGGIGCLRAMSQLCPDSRGGGYSVGRALMQTGYDKERLPRFDHIPSSKLGVIPLIVRFTLRGRSVAVFTEGLGAQKHHGSVAILVNEHSASSTEMVAAFASEYRLATLVGIRTAGRLVAASSFKVGFGYRVVLPVAAYFTWHGTNLEGRGVEPDIKEPLSSDALRDGDDNQLRRARAHLEAAGPSGSAQIAF